MIGAIGHRDRQPLALWQAPSQPLAHTQTFAAIQPIRAFAIHDQSLLGCSMSSKSHPVWLVTE